MLKYLLAIDNRKLILFFSAGLLMSLVYSPFTLSISMLGLIFLSFLHVDDRKLRIKADTWTKLAQLPKFPSFWILSLLFFLLFINAWVTEDVDFWLTRLRIKLPFLLLPLAFYLFPRFNEREVMGLLYFLLLVLCITCVGIGVYYLGHQEAINIALKKGTPMPTPRNHIRFSLLLAYGVISGAYLWFKGFYWKYPQERKAIGFTVLFLFAFIHFLSVRTGLLAMYCSMGSFILISGLWSKRWKVSLLLVVGLATLPVLSYFLIPSFKSKITYMRYDLMMYQEGRGDLYADAGRIVSWKVGYDIASAQPVLGVGAGNLRQAVHAQFAEKYPTYSTRLMPHNQFLYTVAGTGLVGGIVFLIAILFPVLYRRNYQHPLVFTFFALMMGAFMVEHTIENSMGVGFYLFFTLLLLNHLNLPADPKQAELSKG